jgi:hypothetical protein
MVGLFAANDNLEMLFDGDYTSRDLKHSYECALPFLTGAFQALVTAGDITSSGRHKTLPKPRKRLIPI